MRYDTPVRFISESDSYNYKTGNTDVFVGSRTKMLASVTDMSSEIAVILFGKIDVEAYTVIVQGKAPEAFDYILIGDKRYTVVKRRNTHLTTTFYVSGGA